MPAPVLPLPTEPLPMPKPTLVRNLLLAAAVAAGALLAQWALVPWVGPHLPFMLMGAAILFTAATLGRWPAALVVLTGCAWLAVAPGGPWLMAQRAGLLAAVAVHAVMGVLLIACGGRLQLRKSRGGRGLDTGDAMGPSDAGDTNHAHHARQTGHADHTHAHHANKAEQRLQLAQDETGVGLFELDYRANTAYASPALCQILGQPVMQGSMPLQQWLDGLGAGHVAESRRTLQAKVAAGELRYERELRVELPDGGQHWLLSRIRLDLDERGQLAAARGATLDITARKQLVTELEAAQAQLRQQLDDLSRLHALGNRLLAEPYLEAALQAMLDAVCAFHGTPVGLLRLYAPDGGSRVVAHGGLTGDALAQLAAHDQPPAADAVCGPAASTAARVVVADIEDDASLAALRPLARALGLRALHSTPVIAGGSGRVLGVLAVFSAAPGVPDERLLRLTDLCAGQAAALIERERALSLARETQQRFDVALQSSSVAFTILAPVHDEAGRVVDFAWSYANPAAAALIGRPISALIGQRVLRVLPHAWNEPGLFERYVQISEQGATMAIDALTQSPGQQRWLHVIGSPLNGSVVLWFADITQRRQEQQALRDADQRKDEFLATLAHELRNPLAPIRHAADIIRSAAATDAQRQSSLAVIERQLRHMALLLDDLLDVSRITRGTLPLRRERCALQPIVDAAVETARPLYGGRRHTLVLDLPDQPIWLDADPLRLAQVLGNLLVNAAKYTPPGGKVVLSGRREGGEVVLSVTDNGAGLEPHDCERVFGMFVQMPAADGRPSSGLGIGLALARNLMLLHGGRLDATSAGPGHGCTFTARLPAPADNLGPPVQPVQLAQLAQPTPPAAPESLALALQMQMQMPVPVPMPMPMPVQRRILIADDNRDAADSLAELLQLEGHGVHVAYDGRDALARYASFQPEIALLDLDMPEHSGVEVAALIRRQPGGHAITLVALTGMGQQRDRDKALAAGFDHHLTKPVELQRLKTLLAGAGPAVH